MNDKQSITWVLLLGWTIINVLLFTNIPECKGCTLTTKDGVYEGNCTLLKGMTTAVVSDFSFYGKTPPINELSEDMLYDKADELKVEVLNATTLPTTTTTVVRACPVCPDCKCICDICPKCPDCSFELTDVQEHELLNAKCPVYGSGGVQMGCAEMKKWFLDYLEVPGRPKFSERPGSGYNPFYNSQNQAPEQYTFNADENHCFTVIQYPDENDRKRWSWNKDECAGSELKICHL